jgi:hypothetical protein
MAKTYLSITFFTEKRSTSVPGREAHKMFQNLHIQLILTVLSSPTSLNNSMARRSSRETNIVSVGHEISHFLRTQMIQYSVHKNTPAIPIPRQINPYHFNTVEFLTAVTEKSCIFLKRCRLADSSSLKIEVISYSETSVNFYRTTSYHSPEYSNINFNIIFPPTPISPRLSLQIFCLKSYAKVSE